jgi:hypothetical protein
VRQSRAYDLIMAICAPAPHEYPYVHAAVARARNLILSGAHRLAEEMIASVTEALEASTDAEMRDESLRAAAMRQVAQLALQGGEVERETAPELARMLYHAPVTLTADYINQLLLSVADRLREGQQGVLALRVFDRVLQRLGHTGTRIRRGRQPADAAPDALPHAHARFGRIQALRLLNRRQQLLAELDAFIRLFGDTRIREIQRKVVDAWVIRDDLDDQRSGKRMPLPTVGEPGTRPKRPGRASKAEKPAADDQRAAKDKTVDTTRLAGVRKKPAAAPPARAAADRASP